MFGSAGLFVIHWKADRTYWAGTLSKHSVIHRWVDEKKDAKHLSYESAYAVVSTYELWTDAVEVVPA